MLVIKKCFLFCFNIFVLEEKSQAKDSSKYFYKSNYASPHGRSKHSSDKSLNDYLFSSGNPNPGMKSKVFKGENTNLESDREKMAEQENEWKIEKQKLEDKLSKLFENDRQSQPEPSKKAFLRRTESVL